VTRFLRSFAMGMALITTLAVAISIVVVPVALASWLDNGLPLLLYLPMFGLAFAVLDWTDQR
jgi:hypothetical protein